MIKKLALIATSIAMLSGCVNRGGLRVAATPVPHAQLLESVKADLKEQGIDLIIITTDDYNMPNRALANRDVDANFFQHIPFLEEQVKEFDYEIVSLAKIEIEPMGLYSKKVQSLSGLKEGATIAIPNDPSNEARALLLLQQAGLITLSRQGFQVTPLDISSNPKKLKFLEIDAAMLPRSLSDVDAAVINTNYALVANLSPEKDALILESQDSPYANIIAVRKGDETRPDIEALKKAMTSEKMRQTILETYKGAILPAF